MIHVVLDSHWLSAELPMHRWPCGLVGSHEIHIQDQSFAVLVLNFLHARGMRDGPDTACTSQQGPCASTEGRMQHHVENMQTE